MGSYLKNEITRWGKQVLMWPPYNKKFNLKEEKKKNRPWAIEVEETPQYKVNSPLR